MYRKVSQPIQYNKSIFFVGTLESRHQSLNNEPDLDAGFDNQTYQPEECTQ